MGDYQVNINFSWKRPSDFPYPHVWHTFQTTSKTGKILTVKIQDVTSDLFENFINFYEKNFDQQEPISRSIDIISDSENVYYSRIIRRKILEQKVSLIAFIDNENDEKSNYKIIGAQTLYVVSKSDPPFKLAGKKWLKFGKMFDFIEKDVDSFKILNTDSYMKGFGLSVDPEYYGLGIGRHLQSCCLQIAKEFNISGIVIVFSSLFSQNIAEKNGFKVVNEIRYDEYKDENGKVIFPVEGIPSIKLMIRKLNP